VILWGLWLFHTPTLGAEPASAEVESPGASELPGPSASERADPPTSPALASEQYKADLDRLLAVEPAPDGPEPSEAEPIPVIDTFSWWPFALAALGALALWGVRKRIEQKRAEDSGSELRVVGRADLGAQSGLAVVEVRDRSGAWRRLVIGTGEGTPQLVADLGEPQFGLLPEDEDTTVEETAPRTAVSTTARPLEGGLPGDFSAYEPLPTPSEAGLPPLPADPKSGRALVHEVLGERRRSRPARRPPSFHTFA